MTRRARCLVAVLAVTAAVATGCSPTGSSGARSTPSSERAEAAVAADGDATAEEMIAVGAPSDVAVSADGRRRLVTWYVEAADDELPGRAAWRLYDEEGGAVADGHYPQVGDLTTTLEVEAVPDGFVVFAGAYGTPRVLHVGPDGEVERVRRTGPGPVTGDDVLLGFSFDYPVRVWSGADRTVHELPPLPRRDVQDVAVDRRGVVHLLLTPRARRGLVLSSAGGSGPWQRSTLPLRRAGETTGFASTGDEVRLLTSVRGRVDAVWRHPAGSEGRWTREVAAPQGVDVEAGEGGLAELTDRAGPHLVLTGSRSAWVRADGRWRRVAPPVPDGEVVVAGDRLWFLGYLESDLWSSDDLGASWEEVRR